MNNQQYTMNSGQKKVLLGGMILGVVCLLLTYFVPSFDPTGDLKSRFWSNLLHNSVFFTGISFMALFFIAVCVTAWAGWYTIFKRVWEAMSQFLVVGLVLMTFIGLGVWLGWNDLYHWADHNSVINDDILEHKSAFLNPFMYVVFGGVMMLIWIYFAKRIHAVSSDEDENGGGDIDFKHHFKLRFLSSAFLPIAGFSSAAMIWLWVMSVDAHWYSTLFAWYASASCFVSMIALTVMILIYMHKRGYFPNMSLDHFHDLGKFLFAFSIFWTYLWFSQFMLIWYGNVGEETGYFKLRMDEYPILFYGNLIINFLIPFFILIRNDTKRKYGTLALTAGLVLFGHWIDYFLMLKPGILHTAHEVGAHADGHHDEIIHGADIPHGVDAQHVVESAGHHVNEVVTEGAHHASEFLLGFHLPGLLDIGTGIGFLCLFLYFFYYTISKYQLKPVNDPYIHESEHHHV